MLWKRSNCYAKRHTYLVLGYFLAKYEIMYFHIDTPKSKLLFDPGYPEKVMKAPFRPVSRNFSSEPLKMTVNMWNTPHIHAIEIEYRALDKLSLDYCDPDNLLTLCFIFKGEFECSRDQSNSTTITANTNNLFYLPDTHLSYQLNKGVHIECLKINLTTDYIHELSLKIPEPFMHFEEILQQKEVFRLGEDDFITTWEMKQVLRQIKDATRMGLLAPFYFEIKVLELFVLQWHHACLCKTAESTNYKHYRKQINEARTILEESYHDPPGIKELSKKVGMCETNLKAAFRAHFGTSIFNYLLRLRMEMAQKLLVLTTQSIVEIAFCVGYKNASHFSNTFRRLYNMSPSEFRKQNLVQQGKK